MLNLNLYIFRQLIGPFVFFCLIIGGVLWIAQALRISDIVVENGQPASVFLQLSLLVLPIALKATLPIAGFAASVYAMNKWMTESEFVVMLSSGRSLLNMATPFLAFGVFVFVLMQLLLQIILPNSTTALLDARQKIAQEFVTQIVKPGEFITERDRYTFYFGEKGKEGDVYDVVIEENLGGGRTLTHIAKRGQVIRDGDNSSLLLIDGSIQRFDQNGQNLDLVTFDTFSFDMNGVREEISARSTSSEEIRFRELRAIKLTAPPNSAEYASAQKEYHERFVVSLLALLAPLLGMAALCIGGFVRGSLLWRIILATTAMFVINSLRGIMLDQVQEMPSRAYLGYLPFILTAICILYVLMSEDSNAWIKSKLPHRSKQGSGAKA